MKEATARIKINKLLEAAGWRISQGGNAPANIRLEPSITIKSTDLDALGDNFEKSTKGFVDWVRRFGFVDFLLLDARSFPLLVLEAKAEDKNPLVGKEQARKYAGPRTVASSSSPTVICTTSGTSNAAILMS